ncbi:MAG: DUF1349 domain-containing protein [Bacteroidota bacterium]
MRTIISITLSFYLLFSCSEKRETSETMSKPQSISFEDLQWMNEPEVVALEGSKISITADKGTDFFNNPENGDISASAPFLYQIVEGDFVATVQTTPDFSAMWNAGVLMVHIDSLNWIKFAFENSDATGKSIVSVVTRGVSDDANGAILSDVNTAWLRMIKKDDLYALHWSSNGKDFKMARLSKMPAAKSVKIGIEAQCPVGETATHVFSDFSIEKRSVEDLRKGL